MWPQELSRTFDTRRSTLLLMPLSLFVFVLLVICRIAFRSPCLILICANACKIAGNNSWIGQTRGVSEPEAAAALTEAEAAHARAPKEKVETRKRVGDAATRVDLVRTATKRRTDGGKIVPGVAFARTGMTWMLSLYDKYADVGIVVDVAVDGSGGVAGVADVDSIFGSRPHLLLRPQITS